MKYLYTLVFTVFALSAHSQTAELAESFSKIDVFGPFEVQLIKADADKVELDYRGFDQDNVVREIRNGELKLKLRNKHYWEEWSSDYPKSRYMQVKIYYTHLEQVRAQAGAIIKTNGQLKSKNLALICSMGAEMEMDILTKNVYSKISMGGIVELEGQTDVLDVKANMGAVLNAYRFSSLRTTVDASMGADVHVNAIEEITIDAGFGATVDYTGAPSVKNTSRNFGAEIRSLRDHNN